jgi:hypothetical protein
VPWLVYLSGVTFASEAGYIVSEARAVQSYDFISGKSTTPIKGPVAAKSQRAIYHKMKNRPQSLPPMLSAAVEKFGQWSKQQLLTEQEATRITQPLYHYTNGAGLRGIVESQKIWFTSYLHLNDPSELVYGMGVVHRLLKEIGDRADDGLVKKFCERVDDLF